MIDPIKTRVEQLPFMREQARQLHTLAKDIVSSRSGPYEMDDFLGKMVAPFMHKQMVHLKSICILVDADQNPDALIIARSAYENMALLLWSAHGPPEENRPLRWFAYEYIDRYRKCIRGEHDNVNMDPRAKTAILHGVQEYADIFLTNKAKDDLRQGKALSFDPFVKSWPSENLRDIIDELKKNGNIDQVAYPFYQLLSQWPHGGPQGMGLVFSNTGDLRLHNDIVCKYFGGCAIVIGLQSLLNTAILFNSHFELDFEDRLMDFKNRFSEL